MNRTHRMLVITAITLGSALAVVDSHASLNPTELATEIDNERDHISALDLGDRIMRAEPSLYIFDLRTSAEFQQFHIPSARQTSIEALMHLQLPREATVVVYSEGGAHAAQAWVLLRMRGIRNVLFLREGIYEWVSRVFEPRLATDATTQERAEFEHAAALSRFLGGSPQANVPRAEVPAGYWTGAGMDNGQSVPNQSTTPNRTVKIRRRGC